MLCLLSLIVIYPSSFQMFIDFSVGLGLVSKTKPLMRFSQGLMDH